MNDESEKLDPMRLILETARGAVWYVEETSHFWIRFGNIRWRVDEDALMPYRGYLRSVEAAINSMNSHQLDEPVYLKTRDPVINLAFSKPELQELAYLLDVACTIHEVEQGK
jgi:hypothetical protein